MILNLLKVLLCAGLPNQKMLESIGYLFYKKMDNLSKTYHNHGRNFVTEVVNRKGI